MLFMFGNQTIAPAQVGVRGRTKSAVMFEHIFESISWLKMMPTELRAYHLCESQCGEPIDQYAIDEDEPMGVAQLNELKGGVDGKGSANVLNQLIAISSHVEIHKLRFVRLSWRQRR